MDEIIDAKVTLVIGKKEQRHIELNMSYGSAELGIISKADNEETWIDLEPFQARMLATFLIDKWIPQPL